MNSPVWGTLAGSIGWEAAIILIGVAFYSLSRGTPDVAVSLGVKNLPWPGKQDHEVVEVTLSLTFASASSGERALNRSGRFLTALALAVLAIVAFQ